MNNTARQFNLKCVHNGSRVLVRIAPGFNVVDDEHWQAFVSKNGKVVDPYVAQLNKDGHIDFGKSQNDMELEMDPDTVAKSKSEPLIKLKAQLEASKDETEKVKAEVKEANAKADKAESEAKEANAKAEKAELELNQLKEANSKSNKTKDK